MKATLTLFTLFSILGALAAPVDDKVTSASVGEPSTPTPSAASTASSAPVVMTHVDRAVKLFVPAWSSVQSILKEGESRAEGSKATGWGGYGSGNDTGTMAQWRFAFKDGYTSEKFTFETYKVKGEWLAENGEAASWEAEKAAKPQYDQRLLCSIEASGPVPTDGPNVQMIVSTVSPWISKPTGVVTAAGCVPTTWKNRP